MRKSLVGLLLTILCACALGQDSLQFEIPFDELSITSEDYPILISFEYADVSSPMLIFSMANQDYNGLELKDRISSSNGNFIFHSKLEVSSGETSEGSTNNQENSSQQQRPFSFDSPVSFNIDSSSVSSGSKRGVTSLSVLLCGFFSLLCLRQNRQLAIFVSFSFIVYFTCAQSGEISYNVVVQIPNGSSLPSTISIDSPGGSMTSNVSMLQSTIFFVDMCGGNGVSAIKMENLDATRGFLCATDVSVKGILIDTFQGTFEGTNSLQVEVMNYYSGTLEITSDSLQMEGGDYCEPREQTGLYECGSDSGLLSLISPDTSVILPFSIVSSASESSTPIASAQAQSRSSSSSPTPTISGVALPTVITSNLPSVTTISSPSQSVSPSSVNAVPVDSVSASSAPSPSISPNTSPIPSISGPAAVSISPSSSESFSASISEMPPISVTSTISETSTISVSSSISETPTISVTPTISDTPTISVSPTVSDTPTISVSPKISVTPTPTISVTPTISDTPTISVSPTISDTPTISVSPTPTISVTPTPTISITSTPTISITSTPTISITPTPTISVTPTPTISVSSEVKKTSTPGEFLEMIDSIGNRVARSYDGNNWESIPNADKAPLEIDCSSEFGCEILTEGSYVVQTVDIPENLANQIPEARWNRMMLQGTFGANKEQLDDLVTQYGEDYKQWILDQFLVPPTLHRVYFRQRANPRRISSTNAGVLYKPCEIGARYHRNAFNPLDNGLALVIHEGEVSDALTLRIDGILRTELDPNALFTLEDGQTFPLTLTICSVTDSVGGIITLEIPGSDSCSFQLENPPIVFSSLDSNIQVMGVNDAVFVPVISMPNAIVLEEISVECTIPAVNSFIQYDNALYKFDPRIKLLRNSLEEPASVQADGSLTCPSVVKTFLNADYCIQSESCSPLQFDSTLLEMNEETLRAWYEGDRIYVYEIRDLTLESPFDISPCSGNSRWHKLGVANCPSPTQLDVETLTTFVSALESSLDTNPKVRDITLQGVNCSGGEETIGAQVEADGDCFEHVNPDLFNILDFTQWTIDHPGNAAAASGGRPNPIARWAEQGLTYLEYPWHHSMERYNDEKEHLPYVGRWGDFIPFDSLEVSLQTHAMAETFNVDSAPSGDAFLACGSPSETENIPRLGDRYKISDALDVTTIVELTDNTDSIYHGRGYVWFNVALTAEDQLRQRVSWALFQILPIGVNVIGFNQYTETYTSYQDIFIRNALGNYRDILKQVSHHFFMARYLSYFGNRGYAVSQTYPDENYAREIMQLFSIGLWQLNDDGSRKLDLDGNPMATYTNDNILDFARVWTGFERQARRGNMEEANNNANAIDPLQILGDRRDFLPKAKLDSVGYLGDAYPICHQLPDLHWLKEGAHYTFTGDSSIDGVLMDTQDPAGSGIVGRFTPTPTSELYQVLCSPNEGNGECTFPAQIVLDRNLACEGLECDLATISTVAIFDSVADVTKYYYFTPLPCVQLTFFENGLLTGWNRDRFQCANPEQPVAVPICCTEENRTSPVGNIAPETCLISKERMDYDTAKERCETAGYSLCEETGGTNWDNSCYLGEFQWLDNIPCSIKVQIFDNGQMDIIDESAALNTHRDFDILRESSFNSFRVHWANGEFPEVANNCSPGCSVVTTLLGDTCVCDISVSETVVFDDVNNLPSISEVLSSVFQGAVEPSLYDSSYTLCDTCPEQEGYQIWLNEPGIMDENTIFEVEPLLAGGNPIFLFNRDSTASVGSYSFRNPPRFMPGAGDLQYRNYEWNPDNFLDTQSEREVDALLDHLFEHPSTAPFICKLLIQRLVTSNPSPRYLQEVVKAFRTGTYDGTVFSAKYGDLGAAVAAIMLDPEARTPILEVDPTFGVLREPLVRVVQTLRSMEYATIDQREFVFNFGFGGNFGMEPYSTPSVFGFYLPEYRPDGIIGDAGMVSPESQLNISPYLFSLLNAFMDLFDRGLTSCSFSYSPGGCNDPVGSLEYTPEDATNAEQVVAQLDLLLTGNRIRSDLKQHIVEQYQEALDNNGPEEALRRAQKLVILSPEFHVSTANQSPNEVPRILPEKFSPSGKAYKAIIVVIEDGGADTFNKIVPLSDCGDHDLNAEYNTVREGAAIPVGNLLPIEVLPEGSQPCDTFGVHSSFDHLKDLYDLEEALFFANIGALVEPITKEEYFAKPLMKELPPSLFAHNIMQRATQSLHPQNAAATGVLGRTVATFREKGVRSELYSLIGSVKILDGGNPDFLTNGGIKKFTQYNSLVDDINAMSASLSESPLAEGYLSVFTESLDRTETISGFVSGVTLTQSFPSTSFGQQMTQVAKLIHARDQLETERDVFVVRNTGFDTHSSFDMGAVFGPIDDGLASFTAEMKELGIWDDIAILSISEFGRTLTSNGAGTDHGWGGNHFLVGGAVNGKQMLGSYPDKLTEDGDVHIGRGRLLPTTSWDAVWNGLLTWFDVEEADMDELLPNRNRFPAEDLFSRSDLFSN